MIFNMCGKSYRYKRVNKSSLGKGNCGECDPPNIQRKEIRILKNLKGIDDLDTELHEGLHACAWFLSEEHVEKMANSLSKYLWKLGYRKVEK